MELNVDVKSHCWPAPSPNMSEIPPQREHTFIFQGQLHRWNYTENWKEGSDLEEGRTERSMYVSIENIQDNQKLSKLLHRGNSLTQLSLLLKKQNKTKKPLCCSEDGVHFHKDNRKRLPKYIPFNDTEDTSQIYNSNSNQHYTLPEITSVRLYLIIGFSSSNLNQSTKFWYNHSFNSRSAIGQASDLAHAFDY